MEFVVMTDTVALFREWCGDEKYAKFIRTLQTTGKRERRLVFWQEAEWSEFCDEMRLSVPRDYEGVARVFDSVAEIGPDIEVVLETSADQPKIDLAPFREELITWANCRREAGLDLQGNLILRASPRDFDSVADEVARLLSDDSELNPLFRGSTVSLLIKPTNDEVPTRGLTVHVEENADSSTTLAWGLSKMETKKKPWWKLW